MSQWEREPHSVHEWFELSYSNYLVLPRSVMDAMPMEWQHKMTALLDELRANVLEVDPDFNDNYSVLLRGDKGRIVKDEYAEYRRPCDKVLRMDKGEVNDGAPTTE